MIQRHALTCGSIVAALGLGGADRPPSARHPIAIAAAAAAPADPTAPAAIPLPAASPRRHEVGRAADGLFYVDASVNGQPIRFLVDTGASVVVLTAEDARRIGAEPSSQRAGSTVQTVGGPARMDWTNIRRLAVGNRETRDVRAAVVQGGLPVSLLGQNALATLGQMTIDGNRLSFL